MRIEGVSAVRGVGMRIRHAFKWLGITFLTAVLALVLLLCMRPLFAEQINLAGYNAKTDAERYLSLPFSGANFHANSAIGYGAGRYYLRGKAAATVVAAYEKLLHRFPHVRYVYGEMGWNGGGRFWPHRTHRQGMSADFMTPVYTLGQAGNREPAVLPTNVFNQWGYHIRLDEQGSVASYQLDTAAMIAHLVALKEAGAVYGVHIKQVIFDPPLLRLLRADPAFSALKGVSFMERQAWFPHDGHYHVDFESVH